MKVDKEKSILNRFFVRSAKKILIFDTRLENASGQEKHEVSRETWMYFEFQMPNLNMKVDKGKRL